MAWDPFSAGLASEEKRREFDPFAEGLAQPDASADSPNGGAVTQSAKAAARGATAEGVYAAGEGVARLLANAPRTIAGAIATLEGWRDAGSGLSPQEQLQREEQRQRQLQARAGEIGQEAPAVGAVLDAAAGYADQTRLLREQIRQALPIDQEFAQSKLGQIAQGVGQAAGTLPLYAVPGAGAAASVGQIYTEAYDDAKQAGADDATAHSAAMKYLPAAGLDYLSDKLIVGKVLKPLRGKITVGELAKNLLVTGASEGVTEGTQQAYLNQIAKRLEGYDPNRPFDQEVYDSMLVGFVVGGGVTATGSAVTSAMAPEAGGTPGDARDVSREQQQLAELNRQLQNLPPKVEPAARDSAAPSSEAKPGAASPGFDPFANGQAREDSGGAADPAPAAVPDNLPPTPAPAAPPAFPAYTPSTRELTADERAVESRFAETLASDPEAAVRAYRDQNTSNGALIVDVDQVRELSPDYRDNRKLSPAVHEPASNFAKYLFTRALQEQPAGDVVFMAGGGGSGKSTVRGSQPALTDGATIVYDGVMGGQGSSEKLVRQALESGRKVRISYVYTPTSEAWRRSEQRRLRQGRPVPFQDFAEAHLKSLVANLGLARTFANTPDVTFTYVDNSGRDPNPTLVSREALLEKIVGRSQISAEQAQQITRELEGNNGSRNDQAAPTGAREGRQDAGSPPAGGDAARRRGSEEAGLPLAGGDQPLAGVESGPATIRGRGGEVAPGLIVEFPIAGIVVNKDVKQFKADADPQTGVVEKLRGKFRREPLLRQILLWQKANGEHEIITGRHKLDLARRSGESTIPAQILREADGWTLEKVKAVDAEVNIRGGQGKVKDFAQYFRSNQTLTEQDAESRGLLSRAPGQSGWALGRLSTAPLWDLYANNQIAEAKAVAIARGAPNHEAAQASAIRQAKGKTADELELYARNLARSADRASQAEQMGFAGVAQDFADFEREASAVAAVQAERIRERRQLIEAAAGAARRPEAARKMGLPVEDPAALQLRVEQLREEITALENPSEATYQDLREAAGLARQVAPAAPIEETPPAPAEDPNQVGMFARRKTGDAAEINRLRSGAQKRSLTPEENARLDQLESAAGQNFLGFYNSGQAGLGDNSVEVAAANVRALEEKLGEHENVEAEAESDWMNSRLSDRAATERVWKNAVRKGNDLRAQLQDARGELARATEARARRGAQLQAGQEARLQGADVTTQTDLFGPAADERGQFALFRRARQESDAATFDRFARRSPDEIQTERARLEQLRARWRAEAERIAPGLMAKFGLRFGNPDVLVAAGKVRPEELTGWEQAYYDGHERLLYLFDQALQSNQELFTRINLLHEMGHAHWDTLDAKRQDELALEWQREVSKREGPLFDAGNLRPGVAQGIESNIKEWYAERVAWANHDWARQRAAGEDVKISGPVGRAAQQLRVLLQQLQEWVAQLRGAPLDVDFRRFLDQGDRFSGGRQLQLAAARRIVPGSAHSAPNVAQRMREAVADVRSWFRRELTSRGHLPAEVYESRLAKQAAVVALERQTQFALRDLDAAVRAVYGGWSAVSPAQQQQLNDVLGGRAPVGSLDPRLQAPIATMRTQIDALSRRLVREGVVSGSLAGRIAGNVGFYLHRSYRKFDDASWAANVPPAVLDRAATFIRAELRADVVDRLTDRDYLAARGWAPGTPAYRADPLWQQLRQPHEQNQAVQPDEQRVQGLLEYLLSKDVNDPAALFNAGSADRKDLSVLTRRKDLAPELRELLGEYLDPRVNYARSVAKMGQLLEAHRFLTDARRAGMGRFFHEAPLPGFATRIAAEGSQALAPINGLYTSPEIAEAFHRTFDERAPQNPAWRAYLALNGWVKMAKTVLHPVTQVRNFVANFGFLVANGHYHAADGGAAVLRAIGAEFGKGGPAARDYVARLARLGVIGESTAANEVAEALRLAGVKMTGIEQFTDSIIARAAKLPLRAAQRLYQANDEVFKIFAFENEARAWREALPGATPEQIDQLAAERVRNTLPTYSQVPLLVQRIRRAALLGSFVSFPSEVVRTGYHTLRYAMTDLRSNNPAVRRIGARRLAGIALAGSLMSVVSALSRWGSGLDDDDERDVRRFLPEWNQNAQLLFTGANDRGRLSLVDLSYLDPWAYLRKPVIAALRGDNWADSIGDAAIEASSPFLQEGVLAKVLLDISRNQTDTGRQVFNPQAGPIDRQLQKLAHLWTALEPGAVTQAKRMVKAAKGEVSASGRAYDLEEELLALTTGARSQSLDVAQAHSFQAGRYAQGLQDATTTYHRVRDRRGTVDPQELAAARQELERVRAALFREMVQDNRAAARLGVDRAQLLLNLRSGGLSAAEAAATLVERPLPYIERPVDKIRQVQRTLLERR